MVGVKRWMDFLMYLDSRTLPLLFGLGLSALITACSPSVGPGHPWVSYDQIQGGFRPEVSATPAQTSPLPAAGGTVRVATFNVHEGEHVDDIAAAFQNTEPLSRTDVFFFQEIRNYPNEGSSRTKRIADKLGMAYVYAPAKEVDGGTHGLAILSRFPLENIAVMELPAGKLVVDNERRIAVSAEVQFSAIRLRLVNVHLDTRLNPDERILQLRPAVIDAPQGSIIGGDFNTNPLTWAFNAIPLLPLAAAGETDQAPIVDDYMRAIGMTTPTAQFGSTDDFPVFEPRLDSIYLRGLANGDGAVERGVKVSDHWPMWLDVKLPGA